MSDDRPPIYWEGSTAVFRASSVGMSVKAMVALLMGFERVSPSRWLEEKLEEGHRAEPIILREVERQTGLAVGGEQYEVEVPVGRRVVIRAHLDGLAYEVGKDNPTFIVEAKAFGDSLYADHVRGKLFDRNHYYRDQLTICMAATGLPALYAVGRKGEGGEVVEVDVEEIRTPPGDINEIKARILKAMALADDGVLPEECGCNGWCPVPYLHEEGEGREQVDDEELDALCATYVEAKRRADAAEAAKKEAGEQIKKVLVKMGVKRGESGRFKFTHVEYERKKVDWAAVKEMGLEVPQIPYTVSFPRIVEKKVE